MSYLTFLDLDFLVFEKEKNNYSYAVGLSNNKAGNPYKVLCRVPAIENAPQSS